MQRVALGSAGQSWQMGLEVALVLLPAVLLQEEEVVQGSQGELSQRPP
jgi:hypothetical protein